MQPYKKFLGSVINGMILMEIVPYFDLSTNQTELAFSTNKGVSINCELAVNKYF